MPEPTSSTRLPRLGWVLLALLAIVWGANWTVVKVALVDIPIWQYRAITCGIAGLALLSIAVARGQRVRVPRQTWGPIVAASLFTVTGWQVMAAYGLHLIASGEAAVLGFTMPIWATLLGAVFLKEPITPRILASLILAIAGILDLLWPALDSVGSAPLGMLLMIGSALSWAVGTIVQKRVRWPLTPLVVTGWQLVIGTLPIALGAVATEPFMVFHAHSIALWSMVYSCLLAMTFGQYAWIKIVSIFPAQIASIGTVAVPVVAAFFGALLLRESLGWREIVALLCVTSAITLVLFEPARPARA